MGFLCRGKIFEFKEVGVLGGLLAFAPEMPTFQYADTSLLFAGGSFAPLGACGLLRAGAGGLRRRAALTSSIFDSS